MVGHSSVLLQLGHTNILIDPIWSERCSPLSFLGPRRVRPPAVAFEALPRIDLVLVSHNHYDHCDKATLQRLREDHDPLFVTGRGVGDHLRSWKIERVVELDWWSTDQPDLGLKKARADRSVHARKTLFGTWPARP